MANICWVGFSWSVSAACPGSVVIVECQVLAEALKENRSLYWLNLAHTNIGFRGVEAWCSDCVTGVCRGIGPEKLTWYNSLIRVAWGKKCIMMEGVKQLLLSSIADIMGNYFSQASRITQHLRSANFHSSFRDPNAGRLSFSCYSYQFTCSCVVSLQYVLGWFVEASHYRRVVDLTAWVSYLFD